MQRTLSPRWLKPYRSGIGLGGWEGEPGRARAGQFAAVLEEVSDRFQLRSSPVCEDDIDLV